MGATWSTKLIDVSIMDPQHLNLISVGIHLFVSHTDISLGNVKVITIFYHPVPRMDIKYCIRSFVWQIQFLANMVYFYQTNHGRTDTMSKWYFNAVNQDNIPSTLPPDCHITEFSVTLDHLSHK